VSLGSVAGLSLVLQAWLVSGALAHVMSRGGGALAGVLPILGGLVSVAALRAACTWGSDTAAAIAATEVRQHLRASLVSTLFVLGPAFVSRERSGELAHTLTGGIESTDAYVSQYLPQAALALLVPAAIAATVALVDPVSGLVLVLTGPLIPLFMVLIGRTAEARTRRQWRVLSQASARFLDALQGVTTLKVLRRADEELRVIAATSERFRIVTMGVLKVAFLSALALEALATLSTAIVAVEVGLRVLYARLAYREALFVLLLAPEFYRPLRALGASFHASLAGTEAAQRVSEVLDAPRPWGRRPGPVAEAAAGAAGAAGLRAHSRAVPESSRAGTGERPGTEHSHPGIAEDSPRLERVRTPEPIRFEAVSFRYDASGRAAVRDLSFEVAPGALVAFVGPSGAGKSTILQLLLRFVEPATGRILAGGRPIDQGPLDEWRAGIAWVPQRPHLFAGTVRENLLLGSPQATAGDIDRALSLSGALAFVQRLPQGLDTALGERANRLSGGQAQRLALARALLRGAPYLLLDEPTSHLDPTSETRVLAGLQQLRGRTTVVLVTHRFTAARAADEILVLSGGGLLERGSHGPLVQAGGHYARMAAASGAS
jgi:ATP-binding cassette subfamily C protein CydD